MDKIKVVIPKEEHEDIIWANEVIFGCYCLSKLREAGVPVEGAFDFRVIHGKLTVQDVDGDVVFEWKEEEKEEE